MSIQNAPSNQQRNNRSIALIVECIYDFRRPGSSASNASSDVNYRPPSLPGKSSMKATMAAARQQQILHQYNAAAQGSPQHQQQHQQNAANQISNLPDFTVSKNDMSKSASQFKTHSNKQSGFPYCLSSTFENLVP